MRNRSSKSGVDLLEETVGNLLYISPKFVFIHSLGSEKIVDAYLESIVHWIRWVRQLEHAQDVFAFVILACEIMQKREIEVSNGTSIASVVKE